MNVYEKLAEARVKLQSVKLTKTGHNKFAGYHYFELGDFLPTVQQIFRDLKLVGIVSYFQDKATLTIMDAECDEPEYIDLHRIVIQSPMAGAALKGAHDIQNLGAVQTYLRRYLWVTAMEIVEHDQLDATLGDEKKEIQNPAEALKSAISEYGVDLLGIKTILTLTKCATIEKIPAKTAAAIAKAMNADVAALYNQGKNSKGQEILQVAKPKEESMVPSLDTLSKAVADAFGGDEVEDQDS
jgi:hypothetical protein